MECSYLIDHRLPGFYTTYIKSLFILFNQLVRNFKSSCSWETRFNNISNVGTIYISMLLEHLWWRLFQKRFVRTKFDFILFDILCLTPLSAIFQLYHGDQWKKLEYPERTTAHGQATGKLYHLLLRIECTFFVIYKAECKPTPYWCRLITPTVITPSHFSRHS